MHRSMRLSIMRQYLLLFTIRYEPSIFSNHHYPLTPISLDRYVDYSGALSIHQRNSLTQRRLEIRFVRITIHYKYVKLDVTWHKLFPLILIIP